MKKRHLIYAFVTGLLLSAAVCVSVMCKVKLYVENAKIVEQRDRYVTINFYHSNTDSYYMVRVPVVEVPRKDRYGEGVYWTDVTSKLWDAGDQFTNDALFGESALELAKDLYVSELEWNFPGVSR